ncbi:methyltransferase domain-containing protein [bacterium]|nr:methyltransferase domain-containing protein [bacterium]
MDKKKPPAKPHIKGRKDDHKAKTLGPVFNLEEHVSPDWWGRIFNSLYLKTDGDVVDDSEITRKEIDLIIGILNLSPEHRILDLCCGQGRHTLELARKGFKNVDGLDRSHYLIHKAKDKAKSEGFQVKFREGEARKLPFQPDTYDVVLILGNSFGYFETLNDDLKVLREVRRVLKPWGKLLIDLADGSYLKENFQRRSWEWISSKLFVCRERSLSIDEDRLVSREVISHVDKGVIADQFYAERLYSRDNIIKILTEARFSDISFHGSITPDSQRAQDLGMMARRIIVSGQVRKEWTKVKQKVKVGEKNVVVLLGDPQKVDILKPQQVFDDDDFYTIDQMKAALKELNGYRFSYLNKHDSLLKDLMKITGKIDFVLNLCDEGFDNDPKKELHVPAILEMLGIPYTGSGPQCLAFCYDKSLVRGIAKEIGIPVPEAFFIKSEDSIYEMSFVFPVIVKPNLGDSSFGITSRSVAYDAEQLINAISEIRQKFGYEKPILVEEFLTGKDITVGILGTPTASYTILPILEEDYSALPPELPRICGYEAKWCPDSPYWNIKSVPAELPASVKDNIIGWCVKLAERLECRDYFRMDWRLNSEGTPKLLEVNPNPGWCWDGHLAKMANYADIPYGELLHYILKYAVERMGLERDEDVNGMKGTLFDQSCGQDSKSNYNERQ